MISSASWISGRLPWTTCRDVDRILGLGASRVEWSSRPADADYVILADPGGNRFCLVDTAGRYRVSTRLVTAAGASPGVPADTRGLDEGMHAEED